MTASRSYWRPWETEVKLRTTRLKAQGGGVYSAGGKCQYLYRSVEGEKGKGITYQ